MGFISMFGECGITYVLALIFDIMIKPFIFTLMPFDNSFDDIYKLGIKATCEELNTYCERVDEQQFNENILERIYNQINKADIIISDMTGKNPNVFYETGYAHALNKKVILLTQKASDIPFDLTHYPHIIYDGKIIKLKEELKKRVDWLIKNPSKKELPNEFAIDLYINGIKLADENKLEQSINYPYFSGTGHYAKTAVNLKIDIFNKSNFLFDSHFKVGIVVGYDFSKNSFKDLKKVIKVSEKEFLHLSSKYSNIYPSAWESFELTLLSDTYQDFTGKYITFTVRLFSEIGIKDYPVTIAYNEGKEGW